MLQSFGLVNLPEDAIKSAIQDCTCLPLHAIQAPAQTTQVEATHNAEIMSDVPATVDNKPTHIQGQPELKEESKAEAVKEEEPVNANVRCYL